MQPLDGCRSGVARRHERSMPVQALKSLSLDNLALQRRQHVHDIVRGIHKAFSNNPSKEFGPI